MVEELVSEIGPLAMHLFVASWQYSQFVEIRTNMPNGWIVLTADFAENYRTFYQDEIQSAHWQYQQVTVHTTVAYYRCPPRNCKDVVTESMVCFSEDLKHDASSVHAYLMTLDEHLSKSVEIVHQVQFTDGCSCQYKSKEPFMVITSDDYDFTVEIKNFGSRHGKGPCDGLGAVVKQATKRAVERREVIVRTARDMYNYCVKNLTLDESHVDKDKCCHTLRAFFLVFDIKRNRLKFPLYTLARKIHCVRGVQSGVVEVKNLSCFLQGLCRRK
ncbi:uncharacterized protein LOC110453200 [Mizuhopecten yessoensis]|uniref:Uncharacterized protein n=1 Tax=Mizuhopecten yessoensis TaxID=6573 RepID=A0A210QHU8_MIZYE|nr:uncharacterized protein LOC110453200 [Mizuhopecten yessoensis]OWF48334.1 hypothetical protein KP79_PYT26118 [Mizuhopecten yessoensis]